MTEQNLTAQHTVDVAIIGAGVSGLTAARRLTQYGRSVIVLEAGDRVGGRTMNLDVGHGVITEGGGQWIGPGQDRIFALIDELGIDTFKTYVDGKTIYHRNGKSKRYDGLIPPVNPLILADFAQLQMRLDRMAKTVPLEAPWTARHARKWDSTTIGHWLDANALTEDAKFILTLGLAVTNAEDLHWTSLLVQLARIKGAGGFEHMVNVTGGAQESRVVGGTFRIAQRMADDLGAAVVLESPVTEISQNSDGVTVRSARIDVHADRVIVAMSPADASRINFTPDLPTRRSMLQRRWSSGSESKLFAVYDRPFWREQGLSGQAVSDLPVANFVIDNSPPDASVGILLTFMGTAGSGCLQSWPDQLLDNPDARRDAVLADLTTLFGPQAAKPIAFLEKDWAHEPWINGCVGSRAPGSLTQYTDADRRPVGRIHWAGTETATVNQGYFDGAVSAAERAAAEVLKHLPVPTEWRGSHD